MKSKYFFFIIGFLVFLSLAYVSAFGYGDKGREKVTISLNASSLVDTNSSDFWDLLNTPADILGSDINNDLGWITTWTETDPIFSANFTNMKTDCPAGNYSYGVLGNGTLKCRNDISGAAAETDPIWTANFSLGYYLNHTSVVNTLWGKYFYNMTTPANSYTDTKTSTADLHLHNLLNITGIDDNVCSGTDKVSNVTFNNGDLQIVCTTDTATAKNPFNQILNTTSNITFANITITKNSVFIENVTANWFYGMFNWIINSLSNNWLTFNGTTLTFNDSHFNLSADNRINYHGLIGNFSYSRTDNATYDSTTSAWNGNSSALIGCINNVSYLRTDNSTYSILLNQNCPSGKVINGTLSNGTFLCTTSTAVETDPVWTGNYSIFIGLINNASYLSTYNETYVKYAYNFSTLPVNSSDKWDNLNTINDTQMENNGGVLNILESWLSALFDVFLGAKTTDDLTEGTANLYDDVDWNKTYADALYSGIEWDYNQTTGTVNNFGTWGRNATTLTISNITNFLYNYNQTAPAMTYEYNQTTGTFTLYNSTWDNSFMNKWDYNHTTATNLTIFNAYGKWWYNMTLSPSWTNVAWQNQTNIFTKNQNMSKNNITDVNYIKLTEQSGACDLTINHSICSNITGSYFVG